MSFVFPTSAAAQTGTAAQATSVVAPAAATPASAGAAPAVPATTVPPPAILHLPARPAKTTAQVVQPAHSEAPGAAGAIGGTLFALLLVVGLIFGLAWIARRMPGVAGRSNPALRVVASLPLGPRERVVVVDVGGTQLLLGVGAGGTRALHTLATPLPPQGTTPHAPFAQLLAQQFGKKQ